MTEIPTCLGCLLNTGWNWLPQTYQPFVNTPVSLTEEEKEVLYHLKEAWNKFVSLDKNSDDNLNEYRDAIHRCQQIIGVRVARRANPEVWRQPE